MRENPAAEGEDGMRGNPAAEGENGMRGKTGSRKGEWHDRQN